MMFVRELPICEGTPTTFPMEQVGTPKPSIDDVLKYAEKQADKYIKDLAPHLPEEQKDEMRQEVLLKAFKAYEQLDPNVGWRAYIQQHARGAVKDYKRGGAGFKEDGYVSPSKLKGQNSIDQESEEAESPDEAEGPESEGDEEALDTPEEAASASAAPESPAPEAPGRTKFRQRLFQRVSIVSSEDGEALDVEDVCGIFGVHIEAEGSTTFKPRWDLVARMAAVDPEIHLVAKILRGFTQTDLAPGFEVTREMLSQRIRIFFDKLDSPEFYHSPWVRQTIYAFQLEDLFHIPHGDRGDNGMGWANEPVDLDSAKSLELMALFQQLALGIDLGMAAAPARAKPKAEEPAEPESAPEPQEEFGF
jgi:DNA-directed RNA polymerase specialized sigma24 family protein